MKTISLIAALSIVFASGAAHAASSSYLTFSKTRLAHGSETSIIIVGGKGGQVSLNPQPLPPGGDRSIIIVSGKGGEVSLNPQPLPPKERYLSFFE